IGTHWVAIQLRDVNVVYPLLEFHEIWRGIHRHYQGQVEAWEEMYEDEVQLFINRGGH
ncbi:hypothetical protein LINGRAHAP2_LOCUS31577, partial [Linum grandiflorum]